MVRVGLFGIGLDTYWGQFAGLRERLLGYERRIAERLADSGMEVIDAGLVDTPDAAQEAAVLFCEKRVVLVWKTCDNFVENLSYFYENCVIIFWKICQCFVKSL